MLLFFTVVIGGMLYIHHSLQDGSVLRYIDTHAQEDRIPEATYYIGQSYTLFQNLTDASTYFIRVVERYPNHPLAEEALFGYLQCREDSATSSRAELAAGYKTYLDKYPHGRHAELVSTRYTNYTTSR